MKKLLLIPLLFANNLHAQLFSFQSRTGVPTDTIMGGLLGMMIAPMVSKGSDAKLVGGLLGAAAMSALATARKQSQYANTSVNTKNFSNAFASRAQMSPVYDQPALGIRQGKMVKSPYSQFRFDPSSMGLQSGETLFDPFTGQPIVIP